MNISEFLYKLDCDCGDDLPMYAQTERYGEEWLGIVGVVIDDNDSTVTFVAQRGEASPDVVRTPMFEEGICGKWSEGSSASEEELYGYELMLSYVGDGSGTLYPVEGLFTFAEDEDDEESLVFYPVNPAVF